MAKRNSDRISNPEPTRMDMRAVARLANVSIATVSRTINRIPTVDPKLAKRVWEVIREHDYIPNTQARALVSGRTQLLGLIVSDITNPFFSEMIQGFEDAAVENGYEILIGSTNYDPERTKVCIRRMTDRKVEGVAVMTFSIEEPLLEQLANLKLPSVFVDVAPDRPGISLIRVDYHKGIRQGVQHLGALGHRDISFITGPLRLHSAQSRLAAFQRATLDCGIEVDPDRIIQEDHTLEGGERAAALLLAGQTLPTAIICSNDMTAIGVLHKAYREGLRVPDDLSVMGFDNVHITQMTTPPLTTIEMSRIDLARAAVKALRAHLESEPDPKRDYSVETRLVVRESTSFPRGTMSQIRKQRGPDPPTIHELRSAGNCLAGEPDVIQVDRITGRPSHAKPVTRYRG